MTLGHTSLAFRNTLCYHNQVSIWRHVIHHLQLHSNACSVPIFLPKHFPSWPFPIPCYLSGPSSGLHLWNYLKGRYHFGLFLHWKFADQMPSIPCAQCGFQSIFKMRRKHYLPFKTPIQIIFCEVFTNLNRKELIPPPPVSSRSLPSFQLSCGIVIIYVILHIQYKPFEDR